MAGGDDNFHKRGSALIESVSSFLCWFVLTETIKISRHIALDSRIVAFNAQMGIQYSLYVRDIILLHSSKRHCYKMSSVSFYDDGVFIRAEEAGVVRYINKRGLNMQHNQGTGFTLQTDDFKSYYDITNVVTPLVQSVNDLLELFQVWAARDVVGPSGANVVITNTSNEPVSITGAIEISNHPLNPVPIIGEVILSNSASNYVIANIESALTIGNTSNQPVPVLGSVSVVNTSNSPVHMTGIVEMSHVHRCPFGDIQTAERTIVMELKSCFGLTSLRDTVVTQGTGSVINAVGSPEYTLQTSGASDIARLQSAERGRYIAGIGAEIGVGVRFGIFPTGNMYYDWGLFDDSNGFFFRYRSTGLSVVILRGGVETETPQAGFNGTPLTIDFLDGHIFNIVFSWYGYGKIKFIAQNNTSPSQIETILHTYTPSRVTSVQNPNLPLTARIVNAGTAAPGRLFVAGRQYSVIGKYSPIYRINSALRLSASVTGVGGGFVHMLSVRRKSGYMGSGIKVSGMDLIASTSQIIQLRTSTALTGAVWDRLPDQLDSETALEVDTSASAVTGGIVIWTGLVDRSVATKLEDFTYVLTEQHNVTVLAKGITNVVGNLSCCLRLSEEW